MRKQNQNEEQFELHATGGWYCQVATATLAAGAGLLASEAMADITVHTPTGLTTTAIGGQQQSIYFDFLTGESLLGGIGAAIGPSPDSDPFAYQFAVGRFGNFIALLDGAEGNEGMGDGGFGYYSPSVFYPTPFQLAAGDLVGPAGEFHPAPPFTYAGESFGFIQTMADTLNDEVGHWGDDVRGYLGLRFGDGEDFNYGWADVSIDEDYKITLHEYAYNTDLNQPIKAGQTVADADFDDDGDVDGRDFLAWQRGFGAMGEVTNSSGDADLDGSVDDYDLAIWQANYGDVSEALLTSVVPEPNSTSLLVLGAAGLGAYRARRARGNHGNERDPV
jgi:hypothetical protein